MFNFMKSYSANILLAMMITSLGIYCYSLKVKLEDASAEVSRSNTQVQVLQAANEQGASLINTLTGKFEELAKAEKSREERVKENLDRISTMVSSNVSLANKILSESPGSKDLCIEADALINAYVNELKGAK